MGAGAGRAFLAYAEEHEPRYAVAYRLALKFGMRRGEILALELTDIGYDIHVRRKAVAVGSQVIVGKPKSRAGDRTIPLDADPDMPAALRRHRKRQAADRLAAGSGWEDTGLLVASGRGGMVEPWRLTHGSRADRRGRGCRRSCCTRAGTRPTACGSRRVLTPARGRAGWATPRSR